MDINQIKKEVEKFGSDNIDVCGGTYVGGIYSQQIPDEIAPCIYDLLKMRNLMMPQYSNMLEIGSASGASAFLLSYFLDLKNVVIIDDNRHRRHSERKRVLKDVNYREFIGDSHSKEASKFVEDLDLLYDIILIDGDHSYEGVKKDMEMYCKHVSYCGYIILHDIIACSGVKRFFEELQDPIASSFDLKLVGTYESKEHKPLGIAIFRSFHFDPKNVWRSHNEM